MSLSRVGKVGVTAVTAVLLAGCTVGPDFHRPAPPAASIETPAPIIAGGEAQRFVPGTGTPCRWWALFGDPALDALMEAALKANPDLEAAQAALRQAHELLEAQRGALYPTTDLALQAARQRDSNALSPTLASPQSIYSLYTGQLSIAYPLDLFGGVRRQVEGAAAQAEQQRYQYDAAYLMLTANLAVAAIQEAGLKAQIKATQGSIDAARRLTDIARRQQALGQIAGADVAAQVVALSEAEAALPPLQKALEQQHDLVAALAGRFPSEAGVPDLELADFTLPSTLPLSLPSQLVHQRPDIRAAEANLHAASAAVGVAFADRLPNITLTASLGGASTELQNLLSPGNQAWSVAGGLAQPLFRGGALLHRQKAAEAAYDQAQAQYRSTVITAFRNVADVLAALKHDADSLNTAAAAEQAARNALSIAEARAKLGQISGASALVVEQAYRSAVATRIQMQAARLTDTVALFQALGGGWRDKLPVRNLNHLQ